MQSMFGVDPEKVKSYCCISRCVSGYEHEDITYSCMVPNINMFMKYKIFKLLPVS